MRLGIVILGCALAFGAPSLAQAKPDPALKQAQQVLARDGAKVKADGKMGPSTKAALEKYQRAHGLKVTGTADAATLERMGVGKAAAPAKAAAAPPPAAKAAAPAPVAKTTAPAAKAAPAAKTAKDGKAAAKDEKAAAPPPVPAKLQGKMVERETGKVNATKIISDGRKQ